MLFVSGFAAGFAVGAIASAIAAGDWAWPWWPQSRSLRSLGRRNQLVHTDPSSVTTATDPSVRERCKHPTVSLVGEAAQHYESRLTYLDPADYQWKPVGPEGLPANARYVRTVLVPKQL